ncbi:MAG: DMT family transporter [Deltaproteobacteria bacterium]|nr:DMT family transporter [Candidatus Zymogenaceae bacterium]
MKPVEWGMLIILSVIWGGSFFLIEIALRDFHPFTVVFFRVGTAAVVLVCAMYLFGQRLPTTLGGWWPYLVLGALNNAVPFSLIVWGQTRIDSGSAAIFNATTPIFAGILAHFFTDDEKLIPRKIVGMLVGFLGVYMMLRPELNGGLSWRGFGQIAVLGAALMYALGGIFAKRFKGVPPLTVATGMLVCATILMLPPSLAVDWPWPSHPSLEAVGAVATLAVLGTAAAYVLFFRILATAGAVNVLLVTFLVPIGAIVLGVVILREVIRWEELAGMGLIFLGLVGIDGRVFAYLRKKATPEKTQGDKPIRPGEDPTRL